MTLTTIQIVLVLFAIFALTRTIQRFRAGGFPFVHLLLWLVFWVAVAVVVLLPETTSVLAGLLGVGRGADLIVYLAIMAMFYLLFRMFAKVEDLERQITKLVRSLALRDLDKEAHERDE